MRFNMQVTIFADCTNYGEHDFNMLREDMEDQVIIGLDNAGYQYEIDATYINEGKDDLVERTQQVVAEMSQLRKELISQDLKGNKVDPKKVSVLLERYLNLLG